MEQWVDLGIHGAYSRFRRTFLATRAPPGELAARSSRDLWIEQARSILKTFDLGPRRPVPIIRRKNPGKNRRGAFLQAGRASISGRALLCLFMKQ